MPGGRTTLSVSRAATDAVLLAPAKNTFPIPGPSWDIHDDRMFFSLQQASSQTNRRPTAMLGLVHTPAAIRPSRLIQHRAGARSQSPGAGTWPTRPSLPLRHKKQPGKQPSPVTWSTARISPSMPTNPMVPLSGLWPLLVAAAVITWAVRRSKTIVFDKTRYPGLVELRRLTMWARYVGLIVAVPPSCWWPSYWATTTAASSGSSRCWSPVGDGGHGRTADGLRRGARTPGVAGVESRRIVDHLPEN